jgi:heptosyltransferase-2
VLLVGGPGDQAELAAVRAAWGPGGEALRDTLALDVDGLIGAVGRCAALVAGDSGPVHLASALRVPVVALFGPTAPERWAPRTGAFRVVTEQLICSPCSNHGTAVCPICTHACMRAITPAAVLEAVGAVLASPPLALGPAPRLLGDGARG